MGTNSCKIHVACTLEALRRFIRLSHIDTQPWAVKPKTDVSRIRIGLVLRDLKGSVSHSKVESNVKFKGLIKLTTAGEEGWVSLVC